MLSWALKYQRMGLSVIPIQPKGKEPLIPWKEYQTRRATPEEVYAWFTKNPSINIGVVTGAISTLVVVDLDGPIGIKNAQQYTLNSRVSSITGRGKHLWYCYPKEGIKNSASKIAEGIDIRGEGGFVLAPPSIHPNGKRYRWLGWGRPSVSVAGISLPSFPTGLGYAGVEKSIKSPVSWLDEALNEFKNGHVHNNLVAILGKFRSHNFSLQSVYEFLHPHNKSGEMSNDELKAKIEEIWGRYEPRTETSPSFIQSIQIRSPQRDTDYQEFEQRSRNTDNERLLTGIGTLDRFLEQGLQSERVFTIAARTGENKTNTALAICSSICEQGKKVVYFSTEFSFRKIWERYINQLQNPREFRKHAFYVCDAFSPKLEQVEEALKEISPDVFVIDHINHMGEERETISTFMQGCTLLQRKYKAQGIVLAQLNRYADFIQDGKRIEPRLSMIKGADAIGQMSSRVLLLSVTKISPEQDEIEAILDKNDAGSKGKFFLALTKQPYRIREIQ